MRSVASPILADRWSVIESHRGLIANTIKQIGREMPAGDRRLLRSLASFFDRDCNYQNATKRPDVLAVCLSLSSLIEDGKLTETATRLGVRRGLLLLMSMLESNRVVYYLLYPALLVLAIVSIMVLFSQFVFLSFSSSLFDFEIKLPRATELMLRTSILIRDYWFHVACGMGILVALASLLHVLTKNAGPLQTSWLTMFFKTARSTAAAWTWHVSLLLASGLSTVEAVNTAARSQHRRWLVRECKQWCDQFSSETSLDALGFPKPVVQERFDFRFPLVNYALKLESREAQVDVFREIARYYREISRTTGDWWLKWGATLLYTICLALAALLYCSVIGPVLSFGSGMFGYW